MEWWQIVLMLLVSIVVGSVGGALLSHLILRFIKKREPTFLDGLLSRFARMSEAPQASVVPVEADSDELYHGRVELNINAPADFMQLLRLQALIHEVPDLQFVSVGGSSAGDSTIIVIADKPLPLASILNQMPMTKCVFQKESNIQLALGAT